VTQDGWKQQGEAFLKTSKPPSLLRYTINPCASPPLIELEDYLRGPDRLRSIKTSWRTVNSESCLDTNLQAQEHMVTHSGLVVVLCLLLKLEDTPGSSAACRQKHGCTQCVNNQSTAKIHQVLNAMAESNQISSEVAIMFALPVSAVLVFATRTYAAVGFTRDVCAETRHYNRLNMRLIMIRTVEISEKDRHTRRHAEEIREAQPGAQLCKSETVF
jgi:hypothetical protein